MSERGFKLRFSSMGIFLAALVYAGGVANAAFAACAPQKIGEFHLERLDNKTLIDVQVNGHPGRFLLDTGSTNTIITKAAALKWGLKFHRVDGAQFFGVGGRMLSML